MDAETKRKRQDRTIRIFAAIVFVLALSVIGYSVMNFNASTADNNESSCKYAIAPEESGLTPTIYVDLKDGKTMDLTFGELTKFHAECQRGKVRYWVLAIDDFCVRQTIELSSDGTWSCNLEAFGMQGLGFGLGGLWTYPQGLPENGWIETNPMPLMTPVPLPAPGSVIG